MKKAVKIISVIIVIIIMAPLVLSNIWSLAISAMFHMPSEMKQETVCFLVPGLTWNSTIKDVDACLGESVGKIEQLGDTGNELFTYEAVYENRDMTVDATVRAFTPTDVFHKRRVHCYNFDIECYDENDEKAVFKKLCSDLINDKADNKRFTCSNKGENEFSARIVYGATDISYTIRYDVYDGKNIVYVYANAMY